MTASLGQLGMDFWAAESVQEYPDQRELTRRHTIRTLMRFALFGAGVLAIVVLGWGLEFVRARVSGTAMSIWRCLGGMVPGWLGLVAMFAASVAFVQDVYDIGDWRAALGYVWLLLFGRAPRSALDLGAGSRKDIFGILGLSSFSAPPAAPYPSVVVREGQISEEHQDTPLARFGGPGNVVVFNDSAIVLERFGRFVRVAGPGAVFLRRFERIREVLDLRPQERSEEATALTRDGILVRAEVQVRFQLARPRPSMSPPSGGALRSVYRWAWTQAGQRHSRSIMLDTGQGRVNHWPEGVMSDVGSTLRTIVAGYRLDELLEPYAPERDPRGEISERLRQGLDASAREFGAQVLEVRMGALEPASDKIRDEVKRRRVASWQAVWKSEAQKERAKGEAEAIRERGLARAYAQMEIILALTRGFQDAVEQGTSLSAEFIAMRFIESLRQAWIRSRGAVVPFDAVRTLEYLQHMVKREYALPSGEADQE